MFHADIQAGIRAHQKIDVYTDGHPVCCIARRRLQPPYRRFAGVLLDVYFDHFLARGWSRHGDGTALAEFAEKRYEILRRYRDLPSKRFRLVVDAMTRDNWLVGYSSLGGVETALRGISRRFRRENPVASGARVLLENYAPLQSDFEEFFPQLKEYALTLSRLASGNPPG